MEDSPYIISELEIDCQLLKQTKAEGALSTVNCVACGVYSDPTLASSGAAAAAGGGGYHIPQTTAPLGTYVPCIATASSFPDGSAFAVPGAKPRRQNLLSFISVLHSSLAFFTVELQSSAAVPLPLPSSSLITALAIADDPTWHAGSHPSNMADKVLTAGPSQQHRRPRQGGTELVFSLSDSNAILTTCGFLSMGKAIQTKILFRCSARVRSIATVGDDQFRDLLYCSDGRGTLYLFTVHLGLLMTIPEPHDARNTSNITAMLLQKNLSSSSSGGDSWVDEGRGGGSASANVITRRLAVAYGQTGVGAIIRLTIEVRRGKLITIQLAPLPSTPLALDVGSSIFFAPALPSQGVFSVLDRRSGILSIWAEYPSVPQQQQQQQLSAEKRKTNAIIGFQPVKALMTAMKSPAVTPEKEKAAVAIQGT